MKKHSLSVLSVALLAVSACGRGTAPQGSAVAAAGDHWDANNCEIFVDKVVGSMSSHSIHGIVFYVKTLNDHLDSEIAEVGVRRNSTSKGPHDVEPVSTGWQDIAFERYLGAKDYFTGRIELGSEYTQQWAEGVFYVRTVKGTTYWLKPAAGKNYSFDSDMFSRIWSLYGAKYSTFSMIPTQDESALRELNPSRCY